MKRLKRLLLIVLLLASPLVGSEALAQTGLSMAALFEGRIVPQERLVETRVRGKTLEPYALSYYRSLRLEASDEEARQLRQLLDADRALSTDMRTSSKQQRDNTYTCKLQLPSAGGKNRYLCYMERQKKPTAPREVTVIYMEGSVGSLSQLEKILKQGQ